MCLNQGSRTFTMKFSKSSEMLANIFGSEPIPPLWQLVSSTVQRESSRRQHMQDWARLAPRKTIKIEQGQSLWASAPNCEQVIESSPQGQASPRMVSLSHGSGPAAVRRAGGTESSWAGRCFLYVLCVIFTYGCTAVSSEAVCECACL